MDEFYFSFLGKWSYIGLFVVLFAAGLGIPLPEDIPLLAAGWLVHRGKADLTLMIIVGLVGVMVGDALLFTMGRKYGLHVVEHRLLRRFAKPWLIARARQLYTDHGAKILFAARFMPGLRSLMFLTAGTFRVPYWKFLTFDGGAALISVPVWVWVGKEFSQHIEEILGGARQATYVVVGLLLLGLFCWGIWEYRHNLRRRVFGGPARTPEQKVRSAPLMPTPPAHAPSIQVVGEAGSADRIEAVAVDPAAR